MPMRFHLGLMLMRLTAWLVKLDGKETPYVIQESTGLPPKHHIVLSRGFAYRDNKGLCHEVNGTRWYYEKKEK